MRNPSPYSAQPRVQTRSIAVRHSFRRTATAAALCAVLVTGACTTADGRFDAGSTVGLAAGLAAVGGLVYLATRNNGDDHYEHGYNRRYGSAQTQNSDWHNGRHGRRY